MTILEIAAISAITVTLMAVFTNMVNAFVATLPKKIWKYLVRTFTTTISIDKDDFEFNLVTEWVLAQPYGKTMRNTRRAWSREQSKYIFAPGAGHHFLKFEDKPIVISYIETEENDGTGSGRIMSKTSYRIMTFGRDRHRISRFLEALEKLRKPDETRQEIMNWRSDYWRYLPSKRKRTMQTIYIDQKIHVDIVRQVELFLKNEEYYMIRGIPWRLGISLEGPPGTGKTTYATGLAGLFNKPICIMNLASIYGDDNLMNAFANAPRNAIILIEDVDTFSVTASREAGGVAVVTQVAKKESDGAPASSAPGTLATKEEEKKSLTLGGLLNAIDGVAASEGRILIMTTNHPDRLDPALVRSGRIDKRVYIGDLPSEEVERMFTVFFPEHAGRSKEIYRHACNINKPCAWWQEQFLRNQESIDKLFTQFADMTNDLQALQRAGGM